MQPHRTSDAGPLGFLARTARRLLFAAIRVLLLVSVGLLAVIWYLQDKIIFPGAATQGLPAAIVRPGVGEELVQITTDRGERVVALYAMAQTPDGRNDPAAGSRPSLIFFYGNAMCLADARPLVERWRRLGVNVLAPDYLGYGMSGGKPSETGCRQTAEACLEFLRSRGVPQSRVVAAGWSLGGAVAIDLAARHSVGGLVALSTFTSAADMAWTILPIPLPPGWLVHRFDNLAKLPGISCPKLLGHGRRDPIVPISMFERLRAAARPPVWSFVVEEAGHNDFFELGGEIITREMREFFARLWD